MFTILLFTLFETKMERTEKNVFTQETDK